MNLGKFTYFASKNVLNLTEMYFI